MTVVRPLASIALVLLGVAIVASPSVATAQPADETYVIRFPETTVVGERYEMEVEAKQLLKREVREGDRVVNSQEGTVEIKFDSLVKVLEITKHNKEAATHHKVERATVVADGQEAEVLPPGTEFLASAGDGEAGPTFTSTDGGKLPEVAQKVLPRVISFDAGEITMDKLFGSDTPRRVGETWEADKKLLVALAKEQDAETSEEKVKGTAKIVRAYEKDGQTLLDLVLEIAIEFDTSESPLPQADFESAKMTVVQKITMGKDSKEGPLAQSYTMTMQQVLRGKEGTPLAGKILDGQSTETRSARYNRLSE